MEAVSKLTEVVYFSVEDEELSVFGRHGLLATIAVDDGEPPKRKDRVAPIHDAQARPIGAPVLQLLHRCSHCRRIPIANSPGKNAPNKATHNSPLLRLTGCLATIAWAQLPTSRKNGTPFASQSHVIVITVTVESILHT